MSGGLIIRLQPNEKLLVNGAVLANGERRTKLRICTANANVLRMRDALHPDEATTPVKRLYYTAQLAVTGDLPIEDAKRTLLRDIAAVEPAFPPGDAQDRLAQARALANDNAFYEAMKKLRPLIVYEETLLSLAQSRNDAVDQHATTA